MAFYRNAQPRNQSASRHTRRSPKRSERLKAALRYAAMRWPVFPCKPGDKTPLVKDWPNQASTDPGKITAWMNRWPNANIAVVTGSRSGLLVFDVDHLAGLEALEEEHGELPTTRTHATGAGGMHYLYRYPEGTEIRNSASRLTRWVDVRGEGGYVVMPPSATTRPYELLDDVPLADTPDWLLTALRRTPARATGAHGGLTAASGDGRDPAISPIPEGQRNREMFFEALGRKDAGREQDEALCELLAVNAARCEPPLPEAEVGKIVRSAYRYPVRGNRTPQEVREVVDGLKRAWWATAWRGVGGKTERDALRVLIEWAERYGRLVAGGVRFTISWRTLALAAACSYRTVDRVVKRLRAGGWLTTDNATRSGAEAGAFVLRARPGGTTTDTASSPPVTNVTASGATSARWPNETPCFRWSGAVKKGRAGVLYALEAFGPQTDEELAERLGWSQVRDLRARYLVPLADLGLIERRGGSNALSVDHRARVEEVRNVACGGGERKVRRKDSSGRWVSAVRPVSPKSEAERERLEREEYRRQGEEHRKRLRKGAAEDAGIVALMNAWDDEREATSREAAEEPIADGTISELRPADDGADPEIVAALEMAMTRWPDHRDDYPSWWASTLDVEDWLPYKPAPEAVAAALRLLSERSAA